MEKLTPHMFGILHRLERQVTEIARFDQNLTLSGEKRAYLQDHYPQIKRTLAYLRRQAVLMQLAIARKDRLAERRYVQIFYGTIELLRPEVQAALCVARPSEEFSGFTQSQRVHAAH